MSHHTTSAVKPKASTSVGTSSRRVRAQAQGKRPSVAIFVAVVIGLLVIYLYPYPGQSLPLRLMEAYLAVYAHAAGGVLRLFDRSIQVEGSLISGRFPLLIARNCDAASVIVLFLAALAAYPAKHLQRLVGAVAGLVSIFFFNLLRITSLYFIGIAWPDVVELVHMQVWPVTLLVLAALSFLAWVSWAERSARVP